MGLLPHGQPEPWKPVSPDRVIDLLNELVKLDPEAAHALMEYRVPCNEALGDHPSIQVVQGESGLVVGLLGVLNGFFGADEEGWGTICGVYDDGDDGKLLRFERTNR